MNILGLDNGYNYTKTSEGQCILSTVEKGHDDYNNVLEMSYNGENYIIGEATGQYIVDANKFKTEEGKDLVRLTTLAAIGLSYPEETVIDVSIVAGLPVAFYADQKEDLTKLIKDLDDSCIEINKIGKKQIIKINKVMVLPQACGIIIEKNKKNESSLVIDIGGGTWDIAQFDGLKLVEKATYEKGMLVLYSAIAQDLNSKYYTKFEASNIQNIIERKYFTVDGVKKGIQDIEEYIDNFVRKIAATIKRDFDTTNIDNFYLIGGGAISLESYIKKYFPSIEVEKDSQFTNVNSFKFMGELKLK